MGVIDATSINNKYGSENIVINPEYKKKKETKLLIISNNKRATLKGYEILYTQLKFLI